MIRETLRMAWSNIWHHKMRSFLTTLGVIIGVASIIALIRSSTARRPQSMKRSPRSVPIN
ncbi:hypothetical protein [uncultured Exiguobacterium sp.]|uniref:ABC transporter permease n=1 Tax=uncultured Exiguobacterium sp. TaxID=202669 RepID=UPI0025FF5230|nr:hypothetical protein [uncultured Exiguobacterium sp.]